MFLPQINGTERYGGSPKRPAKMGGWHPGQKGMSAAELSEKRSRAQDEILAWVRARKYSNQASKYLELARLEFDPDVRKRFVSQSLITTAHWHRPSNRTQNKECLSGAREVVDNLVGRAPSVVACLLRGRAQTPVSGQPPHQR